VRLMQAEVLRTAGLAAFALFVLGCRPSTDAQLHTAGLDPGLQRHLAEVLGVARQHSIRSEDLNWEQLETEVRVTARASAES
jgi:hypothetical protein